MQPNPLLNALRRATRSCHRELESLTWGDRILAGEIGPEEYERILRWQLLAYGRLAAQRPADPAARLGHDYVIEGSSLGANKILNALRANERLDRYAPFTHYKEMAGRIGTGWKDFLALTRALHPDADFVGRSTASAIEAFETFRQAWVDSEAN